MLVPITPTHHEMQQFDGAHRRRSSKLHTMHRTAVQFERFVHTHLSRHLMGFFGSREKTNKSSAQTKHDASNADGIALQLDTLFNDRQ